MPYNSDSDLPQSVRSVLPEHAQHIYREAFNSAFDHYDKPEERKEGADREETAHKVAWAAVKQKYEKGSDDKWHRK